MNAASFIRLFLLSAIWGASFLFMRIGAPVLGLSILILARVGLAALFLLMVAIYFKKSLIAPRYWKHHLTLGLFNSAFPFLLFAYAAQTVSASLLSILNATASIWTAVISAIWIRTHLSPKVLLGVLLGVFGVALLAKVEVFALPNGGVLAIAAGLGAEFFYGIATTYTKSANFVESFANAHGSMWAALFLGEQVGWFTLVGGAMILMGTILVTGFKISTVMHVKAKNAI